MSAREKDKNYKIKQMTKIVSEQYESDKIINKITIIYLYVAMSKITISHLPPFLNLPLSPSLCGLITGLN